MSVEGMKSKLVDELSSMPVIDAHEHLPPEPERLALDVDVFTLFSHYTHTDLVSSGMKYGDWQRTQDASVPLEERWELFAPFYERVRHTSYVRAARIAAREVYGLDVSEGTYRELSERMKAENTPGIYRRILREKCGIEKCITQIWRMVEGDEILVPVMPADALLEMPKPKVSFDGYLDGVRARLKKWKEKGAVGVKTYAQELVEPDLKRARTAYNSLRRKRTKSAPDPVMFHTVLHEIFEECARLGLVVCVHCGIIWDNWNDFTERRPDYMLPVLLRHRETRFDLYHAGIPWIGAMGVMGKDLPNAHLNLCWTHIISQRMAMRALDEWLDLVPSSKIIAFGGDYGKPVEKVWGHLKMAREDVAEVLARRIDRGEMGFDEAVELARGLFHDNPARLYGL